MQTASMSAIYATLFDEIISGRYEPETRVKEEDLAAQFEVSRTPVREALRQLEQDGLVQILPKRHTKIIGFTVDDVEEIYDIRKVLEQQAMSNSAAHLSIQGLKEIRMAIQDIAHSPDSQKHVQMDARLHDYFIEASRKRRLIAILHQMSRLIQRFRELGFKVSRTRDIAVE